MSQMDDGRILLVDDDQDLLDGLCRKHGRRFRLVPACGPAVGLKTLLSEGPFAVIVSDQRMPVMDGVTMLGRARELAPDTVRVMLTGQADVATATAAVNEGQIFRFVTKPCESDAFEKVLDAALAHHRLLRSERELLERTFQGAIAVLAEVLALANPAAFGRATRIRRLVRHIVQRMRLPDGWQYETAAMLSQIGQIAVPDDVLARIARGDDITPEEARQMEEHPSVARDLLRRIPRLATVAEIVYHQRADALRAADGRAVIQGARILATVLQYDELVSMGATTKEAFASLRSEGTRHDARVLEALEAATAEASMDEERLVPLARLEVGTQLGEEVRNRQGYLVVSAGHELTESSLRRIRNYAALGQLPKAAYRVRTRRGVDGSASDAAAGATETGADRAAAPNCGRSGKGAALAGVRSERGRRRETPYATFPGPRAVHCPRGRHFAVPVAPFPSASRRGSADSADSRARTRADAPRRRARTHGRGPAHRASPLFPTSQRVGKNRPLRPVLAHERAPAPPGDGPEGM